MTQDEHRQVLEGRLYNRLREGDMEAVPAAEVAEALSAIAAAYMAEQDRAVTGYAAANESVCGEILAIMRTYREQEGEGFVDTPGGLEHMGDVWRLFERWDEELGALQFPGQNRRTVTDEMVERAGAAKKQREAQIVYGHDLSRRRGEPVCDTCFLISRLRKARREQDELAQVLRRVVPQYSSNRSDTDAEEEARKVLARYDAEVGT